MPAAPMAIPSWRRSIFIVVFRWRIKLRYKIKNNQDSASITNKDTWILGLQTLVGPAFAVGGWQLMSLSYIAGILLAYVGFIVWFYESLVETALRPLVRIASLVLAVVFIVIFSRDFVFISGLLSLDSYAMRNGDYSPGTMVAGIPWNSHFTDLRMWVSNTTERDYEDVILTIRSDKWNYKAAIKTEDTGCQLTSLGGNSIRVAISKGGATTITSHLEGGHFDSQDNVGDVFETLIENGGYRLVCGKMPAHSSIEIVFALATLDHNIANPLLNAKPDANAKPDDWQITASHWKGLKDKFSALGIRPWPSVVNVSGHYKIGPKEFLLSRDIKVREGN